ncbi:MAG: hypothetical protein WBC22_12695 [Sedimentisphaerales bacterium]
MNNFHQTAQQVFLAILLVVSFGPAYTNAVFQDRTDYWKSDSKIMKLPGNRWVAASSAAWGW